MSKIADLSGRWVIVGHPDETRTGVHFVELQQIGTYLNGQSYYLIDPVTGVESPDKQESLSNLHGDILPHETAPIVTLNRFHNSLPFFAVFTGILKVVDGKEIVEGWFVNTLGTGGPYTMERFEESPYRAIIAP